MNVLFSIMIFAGLSTIGSAYALESGTYFLDDSEYVSILLEVDSQGNAIFEEVFITTDDASEFIMDANTANSVRISDDHSHGKIFGKTLDGDYALIIFEIDGDDVELKAKVWADSGKERIISNGEVISLF